MITKLVIGDLELTPTNHYYIQAISEIGYKTKYPSASLVYLHGSKFGDVYFQNRAFAVELKVGGSTLNDMITRRSNLYKKLTVNEFSTDYIDIEFHLNNGLILVATGIVRDVNADLKTGAVNLSDISFVIEMEQPFFKSKQNYSQSFTLTAGGGFAIPFAIPLSMSAGAAGYPEVYNGGNVFAFPVITFNGAIDTPVLTNVTSGKQMALDLTIAEGDSVVVDTYNRTVIDNDNVNQRDKFSGDFFVLDVGTNQFLLISDNPADVGLVQIDYQYHYISL